MRPKLRRTSTTRGPPNLDQTTRLVLFECTCPFALPPGVHIHPRRPDMRGFEGFFSPVVPRPPPASTARRPWEREEKGISEDDPDRCPPPPSAPAPAPAPAAAAPPSQHPSQHPELAPASASSFGSIPSPVREVRHTLIWIGAVSRNTSAMHPLELVLSALCV